MVRSVLVGTAFFMGAAIGAAPIASAQPPLVVAPLSPNATSVVRRLHQRRRELRAIAGPHTERPSRR
jgi:hypothetical protein